jgi:Phosphotransferase enzyme family
VTAAPPSPVTVTPPTAGLEWACRLLFGADGRVAARRRGQPAPAGFRRAEAYLALPRAANPRVLVPLGSPQAAAAALARNHDATSKKARLAKAGLTAGLRVGLTQRLADRVDVFVDPALPAAERPQALLTEHLRRIYGRSDLEMAVILGVPRLNRKPVLQVLAADGTVVGYVKAAWNELTAGLVRNEARVLGELVTVGPNGAGPSTFTPPALVAAGPWGDLELIAASALPNAARPDAAAVFDPPMPVIAEIAGLWGRSTVPLGQSPYWAGVRARLAAAAGASEALRQAVDWVERRYGGVTTAFGAWHGDFTPWNMARLDGATYVWDWERAAAAPAGLDLLHFLFQSVCRFEGRPPAEAVEVCSQRTPELLHRLDVPLDSEGALWAVYRLELLFRYDEAGAAGVLAKPSKIHAGVLEMFRRDMEAP